MAITYSVGTNTITVTGYTEAVPCNIADLYNADKAGTLSLHARAAITGTDGAPVAVDRAERPADYVVLGGASNDLYITVANWNGTTATIQITGTDRDGAAQTEDIVINANGTYYTTKWFKTITHTQVTAFTATSFDYDLTQGQWGVISKYGNMFKFGCFLRIGDGSTETHFLDKQKIIYLIGSDVLTGHLKHFIYVYASGHFTLGEYISETDKTGENGCHLFYEGISWWDVRFVGGTNTGATGIIRLYGCSASSSKNAIYIGYYLSSGSRIWDFVGNDSNIERSVIGADLKRLTLLGRGLLNCTGTIDDVLIVNYSIQIDQYLHTDAYVSNAIIRNSTLASFGLNSNVDLYLTDIIVTAWAFAFDATSTSICYRRYTFNLKVLDINNNAIGTASVVLKDKDDNEIFSVTTNASGVITEQTASYGYYNQTNGNTLQSYSPHTLTIKKAGYQTYESKFTLDETIDWIIRLIHSNVCVDQEVMLS